jgi:hypothetical protein
LPKAPEANIEEFLLTILDGFVKSPSAALRFIFKSLRRTSKVRLIPIDSRALHLELFPVPSDL